MATQTLTDGQFENLLMQSSVLSPLDHTGGAVRWTRDAGVVTFTVLDNYGHTHATVTATQQPSTDWLLESDNEAVLALAG